MLDDARAVGWTEQEIVTAAMNLANAWYFTQAANRETDAAISAAGAPPKHGSGQQKS